MKVIFEEYEFNDGTELAMFINAKEKLYLGISTEHDADCERRCIVLEKWQVKELLREMRKMYNQMEE
jgi:hypothetical protein